MQQQISPMLQARIAQQRNYQTRKEYAQVDLAQKPDVFISSAKENNFPLQALYSVKLSSSIKREIKIFSD